MNSRSLRISIGLVFFGVAANWTISTTADSIVGESPAFPDESAPTGIPMLPLSDEEREVFWGTSEDPAAVTLDAIKSVHRDKHFLVSDELNQHLFKPYIDDFGRGYLGVGTDQAYLFIGWQKPQFAWLIDYDEWVYWTHLIHFAFFLECDEPGCYQKLWQKEEAERARAVLRKHYGSSEDLQSILLTYKVARPQVARRFRRVIRIHRQADIATFLNDGKDYDFVRKMIKSDRVRPIVCDLRGKNCLLSIAEASKRLDVPIRVLYMSNAEEYWPYPEQFRTNMLAQHFDVTTWILRSMASKHSNGDYRYSLQPGWTFQAWLRQPEVNRIYEMIPRIHVRNEEHIPITVDVTMPKGQIQEWRRISDTK